MTNGSVLAGLLDSTDTDGDPTWSRFILTLVGLILRLALVNGVVEHRLYRATLQRYNYQLLTRIIAQLPPISSMCLHLFCGVRVIRIYGTNCD